MTPLLDIIVIAALAATLTNTHPGHRTIDTANVPEMTVTSTDYGGKLLLSNSPEIVTTDGILYQDSINGEGRVFFHHVNGTNVLKQFAVIFENTGSSPAHVIISRHGIGGPGTDYLAVGKAAQKAYLSEQDAYMIELPPHKSVSLTADDITIFPNMLISGSYDFTTDQKINVKVILAPSGSDSVQFANHARVLPPDIYHLRGTFGTDNRRITPNQSYNPATGRAAITLADNQIDKYLIGIDATDGSSVVNYGNYGVVYQIYMPAEGQAKISGYLNPRGGSYAGVLGVRDQNAKLSLIDTPTGMTSFGDNTLKDVALIGTYQRKTPLWITFSPPGSSNLPVKIILTPDKE